MFIWTLHDPIGLGLLGLLLLIGLLLLLIEILRRLVRAARRWTGAVIRQLWSPCNG